MLNSVAIHFQISAALCVADWGLLLLFFLGSVSELIAWGLYLDGKTPASGVSMVQSWSEAWASGLTWREIMMDSAMDDGDLARLLRRTIDLLAQIPKLPDIDPVLQKNAQIACSVMDRVPISELAG